MTDIEKLKSVSEPYRPSNGTEGMWFEDNFCAKCGKDRDFEEWGCKTLTALYAGKVEEIRQTDKNLFCLNDTNFNIDEWQEEIKEHCGIEE